MEANLMSSVPPSGRPPEMNLVPRDVEELAAELMAYHATFAPLFVREEQRHWALKYLQGQMLGIERKSIEPMALALEGGDVQAMQQFISAGAWDDEAILQAHQRLVAETLGDPDTGVLIIDGCDFPKKGQHSVGVARQYCGPLGKVANCQASVLACYASHCGYTLVDRRLYMPQKWFGDDYAQRRDRCGVPNDLVFRTQPELAWEMIETLHQRGVLPFKWVTFDEHFGNNPVLLDRVASAGLNYMAEVPHSTRVWLRRPRTQVPPTKGREKLCQGEPDAVRVDRVAQQLTEGKWRCYQIKEGAKGPMVAEFAFVQAVAVREGLPGPDVWLVLRRSLKGELKAYLSNAPPPTSQAELVRLSGMRWPVETAIEESKGELGMDHYEVRGWKGWHHHMTMSFLAHHFLVRLRLRLGKKSSSFDSAPGAPSAQCGSTSTTARCGHSHRPHPKNPAPELRCLLLPSSQHLASNRYLMRN